MAVSLSDVSGALQTIVRPFVQDNFPKETILLDQMKRDADVELFNNNFYAPLRTARHGGVVNLANGGSKLVNGGATIGSANVGVKIVTGTFDIQKLAIDATSSTKQSVVRALGFQAESLASDFARSVNRQLYGDGVGQVSMTAGSTDGTTFTIKQPSNATADARTQDVYGSVNGDIAAGKYIAPGNIVGIGSAAGSAKGTVAAVSGTTVTISGWLSGSAVVADQPVYLLDGDGAGAGTAEITGIKAALSSGTGNYAGVARATTGWTPSFDTTSEALSMTRLENVYIGAREYSRGSDKYAIFMNKTLFRKYGDILTSLRRSVNQTELLGGWTGLEFAAGAGRVGVFLDYDVPDGEVIILNMDTWAICQVDEMNWAENPDNGTLLRRTDYLTYQATMVWFMNIICVAPGANGHLFRKTG